MVHSIVLPRRILQLRTDYFILDLIFSFLRETGDQETLLTCSFVNSTWYLAARTHNFRNIRCMQDITDGFTYFHDFIHHPRNYVSCFITHLTLMPYETPSKLISLPSFEIGIDTLTSMLPQLPNLRSLILDSIFLKEPEGNYSTLMRKPIKMCQNLDFLFVNISFKSTQVSISDLGLFYLLLSLFGDVEYLFLCRDFESIPELEDIGAIDYIPPLAIRVRKLAIGDIPISFLQLITSSASVRDNALSELSVEFKGYNIMSTGPVFAQSISTFVGDYGINITSLYLDCRFTPNSRCTGNILDSFLSLAPYPNLQEVYMLIDPSIRDGELLEILLSLPSTAPLQRLGFTFPPQSIVKFSHEPSSQLLHPRVWDVLQEFVLGRKGIQMIGFIGVIPLIPEDFSRPDGVPFDENSMREMFNKKILSTYREFIMHIPVVLDRKIVFFADTWVPDMFKSNPGPQDVFMVSSEIFRKPAAKPNRWLDIQQLRAPNY